MTSEDLERREQERAVKITIENTPEDSEEDDVDDAPSQQVHQQADDASSQNHRVDPLEGGDHQEDTPEAGHGRSIKRWLSNITEIPDDECDDADISLNFHEDGAALETDGRDRGEKYRVLDEHQEEHQEEEEGSDNKMAFIDTAFALNESELTDHNCETEIVTPKELCRKENISRSSIFHNFYSIINSFTRVFMTYKNSYSFSFLLHPTWI